MARELKVFGGMMIVRGKQLRTIVATTSQKKASELTGESLSYIRSHWAVTGNEIECETALACSENVFRASTSRGKDFRNVTVPDYQEFTTIDTPKEERRKLDVGDIWSNSIKCLKCGDVIRSKNRHNYVSCSCGAVAVDGGSWYTKINGYAEDWKNISVPYNDVEEED